LIVKTLTNIFAIFSIELNKKILKSDNDFTKSLRLQKVTISKNVHFNNDFRSIYVKKNVTVQKVTDKNIMQTWYLYMINFI